MVSETLKEDLAALEHRQWMSWTKYLVDNYDLPRELVEKWKENWKPYEELSEVEKEKDRKWMRKVLEQLCADRCIKCHEKTGETRSKKAQDLGYCKNCLKEIESSVREKNDGEGD